MSVTQYSPASLAVLLQNVSIDEDDEQILKHANNVLKKTKSDQSALRAKLVALIKLDRYNDALRLLEGDDSKNVIENTELEHAYCLYKVGRINEASELAHKGTAGEKRKRGLQHVEAQSLYRLEDFQNAAAIYKVLSSSEAQVQNEEYDIRVNLSASDAQTVFAGHGDVLKKTKTSREDLESYETAFNAACQAIARGEYGAGYVLLRRAKELCKSMEGLSEEEIEAELPPVIAQEIYVLIKLGKVAEAIELSQSTRIRETSDRPVKVVATNNDILLLHDSNPHLATRLFESISTAGTTTSTKPFTFQSKLLHRNSAALAFQTGKLHSAKSMSAQHLEKYPEDYSVSAVTTAAALHDSSLEIKHKSTVKTLHSLINEKSGDIGLAFTAIQLYMKNKNIGGAIQVAHKLLQTLENDPAKRFMPGLVGVVVGLYVAQGRTTAVKEELDKASAYWRSTESPNSSILLAAGTANLSSSNLLDQTTSASIFSSLNTSDPSALSNAGFIASNPTKASAPQLSQLSSLDKLISSIDINVIIAAGIAQPPSKKRPNEDTSASKTKSKTQPSRKKRKIRLPKGGIDPSKQPDPERWLPLRDRSSYKPKGKKDKKRAKEATQGGVVDKEGDVEMIGGNSVKKVPAGQAGGSVKNKKKKGRK